ncbi:uncharacterized protein M6B38_343505 [Iris pallida]|uniref:Homeobox domain-containing protein n=1 Tax=Iris pallida TaxID=29817 RepID=A0AAX6GT61_IRIPA|nr:uncharacterized protein M6B38_343505 [Iris pallida]
MNSQRNVISPERSKRKLKTPAQLEALEQFYNEHKYPSESRKLEFAKQIGLSEKQVSGWFCHRRLKDKRLSQNELCTKGTQNVSNGAIHDLSSGLRQESCNSTKQSDRHYDSKEVESRRFDGHNSSVAFSASEQRDRAVHTECYIDADDRSSGSSTASHERIFQQGVKFHATKPKYPFWDANLRSMDGKGVKTRGYMMDSGSLRPKDEAEIPAVSFVKLKLGRRYCEDGPPLVVDFDPLPHGAFDSPVGDSNCGPYYVGDSFQLTSCSPPFVTKEPKKDRSSSWDLVDGYSASLSRFWRGVRRGDGSRKEGVAAATTTLVEEEDVYGCHFGHEQKKRGRWGHNGHKEISLMYDKYSSENIASSMLPNRSEYNRKPFHHQNDYSGCQVTPVSSITKSNNHRLNQTFIMNEGEDTAGEASDEYKRNNGRWSKYRGEEGSNESARHCYRLNGLKAKDTKSLPYPHSDYKYCAQREPFGVDISHPAPGSKGFLIIKGNPQPKRSLTVLNKKIDKEKKTCMLQNSVRPQVLMSRDAKLARRVPGLGLQRPDFFMKGSQKFPRTKSIIRYSEDSASSSTEDETGGITSTME